MYIIIFIISCILIINIIITITQNKRIKDLEIKVKNYVNIIKEINKHSELQDKNIDFNINAIKKIMDNNISTCELLKDFTRQLNQLNNSILEVKNK